MDNQNVGVLYERAVPEGEDIEIRIGTRIIQIQSMIILLLQIQSMIILLLQSMIILLLQLQSMIILLLQIQSMIILFYCKYKV
jgi:hypothetical protein